MGSFMPCIQMDAYPYEHSPKRKVVPAPYFQVLQAVVVQYAVVDTLTGCTFAVYFAVFFGIPWDPWMEAEVAVILYVDGAPVVSGGAFCGMGAGIYAAAFQRAAVFVRIFYGIIAPWTHFMPGRAEWMSGFVKSDVWGAFSDDFALPLMSIRALISQRSSSS